MLLASEPWPSLSRAPLPARNGACCSTLGGWLAASRNDMSASNRSSPVHDPPRSRGGPNILECSLTTAILDDSHPWRAYTWRAYRLGRDGTQPISRRKSIQPRGSNRQIAVPTYNHPPSFWDDLSKVRLTSRALREHHRRNNARPCPTMPPILADVSTNLARFARQGGPDLGHIRGVSLLCPALTGLVSDQHKCPAPKRATDTMDFAPSYRSSPSLRTQSTARTRRSSAYGKDFVQHLTNHGIHINNRRSRPRNMTEMRSEIARERASLSPSKLSKDTFEDFQRKNEEVHPEADVMSIVVPLICGKTDIPNKQNVLFTGVTPVTNKSASRPKPDFFDGALLRDIAEEIRNDPALRSTVIPTRHPTIPVALNLFLEVKRPEGHHSVAQRQSCFDGTYGARSMHALQTYGDTEPAYDGNAYTYSSTYCEGSLKLYAHHITAPTTSLGRPEYHMSYIDGWQMTGNMDTFRRGAAAFRNIRDLAKRHRDSFIQAANARAFRVASAAQDDVHGTTQDEAPEVMALQDARDVLQQQLADTHDNGSQDGGETKAASPCLDTEDKSCNPSQGSMPLDRGDLPMSPTSSLASASKRQRHPLSCR